MDLWLHRHRCAVLLSTSMQLLFQAADHAREGKLVQLSSELENLTQDLVKLHRDALQLPPQRSTSLQDREEDVPFG